MKILVTGAAGFIGAGLSERLLTRGDEVVGVDNLSDYYEVSLKEARVSRLAKHGKFRLEKNDITDRKEMAMLFDRERPKRVVHLAAQAGVRYIVENPDTCTDVNLLGFANILEACRQQSVEHLVYASSSSVYGAGTKLPFSEHDPAEHPVSLYAASKRANELMAHSYSHLFSLPTTGLRFFTTYGPWGRPDMALFKFVSAILEGKPVELYNYGKNRRDFVYIDDMVESIERALDSPAKPDPRWSGDAPNRATSSAPSRVYNIGSGHPVEINEFVKQIEKCLGKKAEIIMLDAQLGDVPSDHASTESFTRDFDYRAQIPIEEGVKRFIDWYKDYYRKETR